MMKKLNELKEFTFRRIGSSGCEILFEGVVVAWTVDEAWAALIVARMNNDPCDTISRKGARRFATLFMWHAGRSDSHETL